MIDQSSTSSGTPDARTNDVPAAKESSLSPALTANQGGNGSAATPSVPAPTFDVLPLSSELRETLAEIGYVNPTPVQVAVWEPATRGRDAVVQARTGTGKTASFGLPIVDHLVKRSALHAQVLVLAPTRELALQVTNEVERLGKRKGIRVVAVYGGAPMPKQIEAIAAGAQVIVGTPGRVLDHLRRGTLDPKNIRLLVLDECDEMLSMGFERELNAILERLPTERQTLLFSATLPPDIERIARGKLRSPDFVTLSGDHIGALQINHFVYMVAADKLGTLVRVIEVENPENAIIFCNTKEDTEVVAGALTRQGFEADWLNGDLDQNERERVMRATREGKLRFLVATDVAARGIDVSHVTHVINYDFPQDAESYVHRTGRTGRAGRTGTAIALITPQDIGNLYLLRLTYKIKPIERQIPSEGELATRSETDLVNMLAEAFASKGAHPDDLSLARRLLSHDAAERILAGLLRSHLGARPTAREEAAAARRAKPPTPARVEAPPAPKARAAAPAAPAPAAAPVRATPPPAPAPAAAVVVVPDEPRAPAAEAAAPAEVRAPAVERERERDREAREPREPREPRENREPRERRVRARRETRPEMPRPPASTRAPARIVEDTPAVPPPGRSAPRARQSGPGEDPVAAAGPVVPVAGGAPLPPPATPARQPVRHADFATWQPPEEEGDDQPILGEAPVAPIRELPSRDPAPQMHRATDVQAPPAGDYAEIFVSIGRRDGVRSSDLQELLVDHIGLDKDDVKRIRVRERNAFVSVRKSEAQRAIDGISKASWGNRSLTAEIARERPAAGSGEPEADNAVDS